MPKSSAAPRNEILTAALSGLEAQRQRLDEQIAEVRSMMGRRVGRPPSKRTESGSGGNTSSNQGGGGGSTRKRRTLSAEARKRIAAAQKKRWAAYRKTQE